MSVVFANYVLLPFLVLGFLPLIIHLFARSKPPVYHFASNMFIRRLVKQTARLKKPKDWLLLLLRTLLICMVILMFCKPRLFMESALSSPFERRNCVVIVDASASMACIDGSRTRFNSACSEASEILSGLSTRDQCNVVWMRSQAESVFPMMGTNRQYLQSLLPKARVSSHRGKYDTAIRLGVELLEEQKGAKEIFLISDFQSSTWPKKGVSIPDDINLIQIPVGSHQAENLAITEMIASPTHPFVGETITITCKVNNYSPHAQTTQLYLSGKGVRQNQKVTLPEWGDGEAVFSCKAGETGQMVLEAAIDQDSFPDDNKRLLGVQVVKALNGAIVSHDLSSTAGWQRVVGALEWARLSSVSYEELDRDGNHYDFLLLSGWDGKEGGVQGEPLSNHPVYHFLRSGKSVMWAPAKTTRLKEYGFWMNESEGDDPGSILSTTAKEEAYGIVLVDEDDPLFSLFADGTCPSPAQALFRKRFVLPASMIDSDNAIITYGDGQPALSRAVNNGTMLFWNMQLNPTSSTLTSQVGFLPLMGELLLKYRPTSSISRDYTGCEPGTPLRCQVGTAVVAPQVSDPEGIPVSVVRSSSGDEYVSGASDSIGVYTWKLQEEVIHRSLVNLPPLESDLRTRSDQDINKQGITVVNAASVRDLHSGVALWPFLAVLTLLLVVMVALAELWGEQT